ncbi:MAG TPA: hypothetical protein VLE19_00800 [Pyrinomonadaceae bacterium]|nr:hypothetical protein [Pyrinomonadaceae bacterium]
MTTKHDKRRKTFLLFSLLATMLSLVLIGGVSAKQPEYEPAYINGKTVTINAIEVAQHAPLQAQADLYLVVYPIDWETLGVTSPQCNPCDHEGDGIDFFDFHDHVLDSIPSDPGHGEFRTLWHVFGVAPAYSFFTGGDPANDDAVGAAYAQYLPATSEAAVDNLLDATLPDGSPVAIEVDTGSYFLCSVVNQHAAP